MNEQEPQLDPDRRFAVGTPTTANDFPLPQTNRIESITITQLDYGYAVNVGCKQLVFEHSSKMLQELGEYINQPRVTTQRWEKTFQEIQEKPY